eukprot:3197257-Rhodomonas_salina.2
MQLGLLAEHMRPFNPNIPAQVEEPDSLVASAGCPGNLTQGFSATYTDPRFGDSSSSQNPFSSSFDDISRAGPDLAMLPPAMSGAEIACYRSAISKPVGARSPTASRCVGSTAGYKTPQSPHAVAGVRY